MTQLDNLNKIIDALKLLSKDNSGFDPRMAVALAYVFRRYADEHQPLAWEEPVMGLADAVLAGQVVGV